MKRMGSLWMLGAFLFGAVASATAAAPKTSDELYALTNIWAVRLQFTAQNWTDMEPRDPGNYWGGRRGVAPGPMLTAAFSRDGDANRDGKLSQVEMAAVAEKWFAKWDGSQAGKLDVDQLRDGVTATIGPLRRALQGREGQRNGVGANMEYEYVHADLEFDGQKFTNVAARYKGNGTFLQSRRLDKKPMKVDLNKNVKGQKLARISTLNFHNAVTDPSWMNDVLSYRLYRDAGVPAPRTAFARVKVNAPPDHKNEYFGLYTLVENIDDDFTERVFKVEKGALFKPSTPNLFADLGDDWSSYNQTYDPKEASKEDKQRLIELCKFATKSTDAEFAAKLGEYIDLNEFARYMAVTVWLTDLDGILGPGQNFYLFLHPQTRKVRFIAWDQDHSFGQMRGTQEERERLSIHKPWTGYNPFLERVYKVDAFKKQYLAHLDEISKGLGKPERFHKQVDELAAIIRPAVREESVEKMRQFELVVAGYTPESGSYRPFGPAKPIKGFVTARHESIMAQLADKEAGAEMGTGGFGRGFPPPGAFLGSAFLAALDGNADEKLTREEAVVGFKKWFNDWNANLDENLSEEELRAGITNDLTPALEGGPGAQPPRQRN